MKQQSSLRSLLGSVLWAVLWAARWVGSFFVLLLKALITGYQRLVSPLFGPCCRFLPSCSCYAKETLAKDGLIKGLAKTTWRLARCHPFGKGGYDPP